MDREELKAVVALHAKFLAGDKKGKRADLSGADLCNADMTGVDLSLLTGRGYRLPRG